MDRASERDIAALQGDWNQINLEADGVSNPPDDYGTDLVTTFTGNQFVVRAVDGTVVLVGAFTLDASTTPKSVTWVDSIGADAGKSLPAIYILDGDTFKFIVGAEGAPRPQVFRTIHGQTMRTLRRR
ncbi:MAG: TIGR03067 domain-containing protein [Deltaproteobacteria bacterium]|nr:TIGR03067 domain-containing protein [Deltaproteobacteria bacterium]